jgi:hypothetical protein
MRAPGAGPSAFYSIGSADGKINAHSKNSGRVREKLEPRPSDRPGLRSMRLEARLLYRAFPLIFTVTFAARGPLASDWISNSTG